MEHPIIVRFRWSADDLYQGYCYHQRQGCRRVIRAMANATIYTLAVISGLGGIYAYRTGDSWIVCFLFALFGLFWWSRSFWHRRLVWRQFAKRPDKDLDIEWEIGPDRILVRSPIGNSDLSWKAFAKVVRTPSGIMFYPIDRIFHYLPRHGFASDAEFEQVMELAKSKVPKVRYVT